MARSRGFNLTAEINLRGPSNIRTVVADIRRQLGSVTVDINPRISPNTARTINNLNNGLTALNRTLSTTQINASTAATALNNLGRAVANIGGQGNIQALNNAATACQTINQNANRAAQGLGNARTQMEEFGRQSALAVRRFAAFSVVTVSINTFINALSNGIRTFIDFDKEFVRLQQVTGESARGLKGLAAEITQLSTSLGVASTDLTTVAVTLAQAGLSSRETSKALQALAKSALAPSFDDLNQTVEGSIALMRQFGIGAGDLETALGSVNAVAAQFAVEAGDLITAIQRTGGVFATSSKGVSEGTKALNEFLAIFTSVRATTRESAETIATGLRTIFTRIQRGGTIEALKEYGVVLTDLEGKFVGPYEAVRRLSEGLSQLDPRDIRFSQIIEELGGFRQIGKVIPLIQQFAVAQKALNVAQTGGASLSKDAATAQLSLANQIAKVREEFLALIRSIGESQSFRSFIRLSLDLASALIRVADAAKVLLPAITAIAAVRGASALTQFATGFAGGIGGRRGGGRRFATGGLVPGSGNSDSVSAMLTPGEYVIRKKAVQSIGVDNLHNINKYARGGLVQYFQKAGGVKPLSRSQQQTLQSLTSISNSGGNLNKYQRDDLVKLTARQKAWEEAQPALRSAQSAKNMDILAGGMSVPKSRLLRTSSVGYAILSTGKGSKLSQANVPVTSTDILSSVSKEPTIQSFLRTALSSRGTTGYTLYRQGLSPEVSKEFNIAIDKGLLKGINTTVSTLSKGVLAPLNLSPIRGKEAKGLIAGINPGAKASFFEEILTSAKGREPYDNRPDDANRPFDFPNGLGRAQRLFPGLPSAYVDAKSSAGSASLRGMAKKIGYQIYLESTGQTIGTASKKRNKKAYGGMIGRYASGGNVDTVPAMLTPGEYVINKRAASKLGSATLNRLNNADRIPGFNKGGSVGNIQNFAFGGAVATARAALTAPLGKAFADLLRIIPGVNRAFSNLEKVSRNLRASQLRSLRNQGYGAQEARGIMSQRAGMLRTGALFAAASFGTPLIEQGLANYANAGVKNKEQQDMNKQIASGIVQGVVGGGAIGGAIGSAILPGIGTVVGGGIGAAIGGVLGYRGSVADIEAQQKTREKEAIKPFDVQEAAATAIQNLQNASESLTDVFRKMSDNANRFGLNLEESDRKFTNSINIISGKIGLGKVSRLNEKLVANLNLANVQETRAVAASVESLTGGSEAGRGLSSSLVASKIIQDVLPGILRNTQNRGDIREQLREALRGQGVDVIGPISVLLDQISAEVSGIGEKDTESFQKIANEGIAKVLGSFNDQVIDTTKTLFKNFNDSLDLSIEYLNQYAEATNKVTELQIRQAQIIPKANVDLIRALGGSPSLAQLNAAEDARLQGLTQGLVPGGTNDPMLIGQSVQQLAQQTQDMMRRRDELQAQMGQPGLSTPETVAEFQALNEAIISNQQAINNGTEALEMLSTGGERAANILNKIQDRASRGKGFVNFLQEIVTASPEEQARIIIGANVYKQGIAAYQQGEQQFGAFMQNPMMAQQFFEYFNRIKDIIDPKVVNDILNRFGRGILGPMANMAFPTFDTEFPTTFGGAVDLGTAQPPANDPLIKLYEQIVTNQQTATTQLTNAANALASIANTFSRYFTGQAANFSNAVNVPAQQAQGRRRGGLIYANKGMYVNFEPKGPDKYPAMLSDGEFVINRESTRKNLGLLKAINSNKTTPVQYMQDGGQVDDPLGGRPLNRGELATFRSMQRNKSEEDRDPQTQAEYEQMKRRYYWDNNPEANELRYEKDDLRSDRLIKRMQGQLDNYNQLQKPSTSIKINGIENNPYHPDYFNEAALAAYPERRRKLEDIEMQSEMEKTQKAQRARDQARKERLANEEARKKKEAEEAPIRAARKAKIEADRKKYLDERQEERKATRARLNFTPAISSEQNRANIEKAAKLEKMVQEQSQRELEAIRKRKAQEQLDKPTPASFRPMPAGKMKKAQEAARIQNQPPAQPNLGYGATGLDRFNAPQLSRADALDRNASKTTTAPRQTPGRRPGESVREYDFRTYRERQQMGEVGADPGTAPPTVGQLQQAVGSLAAAAAAVPTTRAPTPVRTTTTVQKPPPGSMRGLPKPRPKPPSQNYRITPTGNLGGSTRVVTQTTVSGPATAFRITPSNQGALRLPPTNKPKPTTVSKPVVITKKVAPAKKLADITYHDLPPEYEFYANQPTTNVATKPPTRARTRYDVGTVQRLTPEQLAKKAARQKSNRLYIMEQRLRSGDKLKDFSEADRRLYLENMGVKPYAVGGLIASKDGTRIGNGIDNQLIRAQSGEFIMNRRATANNLPTLQAMNRGRKIRGYQYGGMVDEAYAGGGAAAGGGIGLDDQSRTVMLSFTDSLSSFGKSFGAYIDKLSTIKIPDKIEMTGNHVVEVNVTGAAAFDAIQEGVTKLINSEIGKQMNLIWSQSGGQLGKPEMRKTNENPAYAPKTP